MKEFKPRQLTIKLRDQRGRYADKLDVLLIIKMLFTVAAVITIAVWLYTNKDTIKSGNVAACGGGSGSAAPSSTATIPMQTYTKDDVIKLKEAGGGVVNETVTVTAFVLTPTFPEDHDQRHLVVKGYLKALGESDSDIETWDCIMEEESKGWQHSSDTLGAGVEGSQARGFFQLMPSTVKDYQDRLGLCQNAYDNWITQVNCAVDIKRNPVSNNGFNAWDAYRFYCAK